MQNGVLARGVMVKSKKITIAWSVSFCHVNTYFNSCTYLPPPYGARLAQSVEHETLNLRVVGSSPTLGVDFFYWSQCF